MKANTLTNTLKERVIFFLKFCDISKAEFSRLSGTSFSYVSSIKKNISVDKVQALRKLNKNLSLDWLLLNEGEMLTDKKEQSELQKENESLKRQISLLEKVIKYYEEKYGEQETAD